MEFVNIRRLGFFCSFLLNIFSFSFILRILMFYIIKGLHCGLKVSRSQAKINENFSNYFLKTKANNKCYIVLNVHVKGYRKV